jgi:hypothetical protein
MSDVQTHPSVSRLEDNDMQAVPVALARAAQRAREIAARTGTPLIVVRDGKLIEEMVTGDIPKSMDSIPPKR